MILYDSDDSTFAKPEYVILSPRKSSGANFLFEICPMSKLQIRFFEL